MNEQGNLVHRRMLVETIVVGDLAENCYIVGCPATGEAMVIDPGDEPSRILDRIAALGLHVVLIANTHAHVDHVLAILPLQRATHAPFAIHPADLPVLQAMPDIAISWFGRRVEVPATPDRPLADGEGLTIGQLQFRVIHTPGHSPGGVSFFGEGALFAGDTLFRRSIGRADIPGANQAQIVSSIREKLYVLPDETVVYPGHGPTTTVGEEKAENPFVRPLPSHE